MKTAASLIETNHEILGGTPVFTGTRVPVQCLFDHLQAGDSNEDFLEGFPSVKREQVVALLDLSSREYLTAACGVRNSLDAIEPIACRCSRLK